MNESNLVELRYCSEAVLDLGILGLMRILHASITSNKRLGITGVLFFDRGRFGQILEGSRKCIEETWDKIQKDPMHHSIEFLGIAEIQERQYPGWAMKLFDDQGFSSPCPEFNRAIHQMGGMHMHAIRQFSPRFSA